MSMNEAEENGIPILKSDDGGFYFIVDETDQYAKILWCSLNQEILVVPTSLGCDGKMYSVYTMGNEVFVPDSEGAVPSRDAVKTLVIENGAVEIALGALGGLSETIQKVVFPRSVKFSAGVFQWFPGTPELVFDRDDICVENGIIYDVEKKVLIAVIPWQELRGFKAPHTLEEISDGAFRYLRSPPDFITVDLGDAVNLRIIGPYSFNSQEAIKTVIIPASVAQIGERAFGGCHGIQELMFLGKNEELAIGEEAFRATGATKWKINVPQGTKSWFVEKLRSSGFPVLDANVIESTSGLVALEQPKALKIYSFVAGGALLILLICFSRFKRTKKL
jgi:hypothetical protein